MSLFFVSSVVNLLKKKTVDSNGSFTRGKVDTLSPMTPNQEAKLRGAYYDCPNVRILIDELDRRDEIIKAKDHELWLIINKRR